ncbi:alpha/beta fold hydrolase [Aquihabitans sp. McL0605]|uniref:alpha/beta fold hydrolase n=1 Tax=Aquihabitans sp. McL0605 TaxID=3415671 RepID=UPI003CF42730
MGAEQLQLTVGPYQFDAVAWGPAEGAPVLLLHGFPESSWAWRFIQPPLADAGYRSVAPDLRGYSPGARPPEASAFAIEALVDDVFGLADALGWERFHLVGHDWGGVAAWHAAGREPERILTLTVVATPHPRALQAARDGGPGDDGDDQAAKSAYLEFFRAPGAEDAFLADDGAVLLAGLQGTGMAAADAAHYVARAATPEAMVGMLNWYRGADPTDAAKVGPVTSPTMYVYPDADTVFGPTAAGATAAEVDGPYRYEVLDGVSHWAPEEAADDVVTLLLEHLADAPA